ncbi:MAG: 6-carboxytetrahydropterin synthase QueD [Burkholderiales bacterium]
MQITRRLEFDAGHRIPNHASLCRHLHGHRYAIEVTLSGPLVADPSSPEQGMVADFSRIKAIAKTLVDRWDHAFLVYVGDTAVRTLLDSLPEHRTVVFNQPPTAEHLAASAYAELAEAYASEFGSQLRLERVRLFETPNCWADAGPDCARG